MIFVTCSKSLYLHRITIACNCFIWRIKFSGIKHWRYPLQERTRSCGWKLQIWNKVNPWPVYITWYCSKLLDACVHWHISSFDTAIFTSVLVFFKIHFNSLGHVFWKKMITYMMFVRMERLPNHANFLFGTMLYAAANRRPACSGHILLCLFGCTLA